MMIPVREQGLAPHLGLGGEGAAPVRTYKRVTAGSLTWIILRPHELAVVLFGFLMVGAGRLSGAVVYPKNRTLVTPCPVSRGILFCPVLS